VRLPWVTREHHDQTVALYERAHAGDLDQIERQTARADRLETECARLHALTLDMKRAGFNPPEKAPTAQAITDPLPKNVVSAIERRMDPLSSAGRETRRQALIWLSLGTDPDEVERRILHGAEPE